MTTLLYLAAGVLFILGLRGLGSPRTARRGNLVAAIGMLLAIVVTVAAIIDEPGVVWGTIIAGLIVGGGIGAYLALRVQMTAMPQLVAAFNGFGGGASALVASAAVVATDGVFSTETSVTVALSIAIGVVTFSGSFVAYAKLQGLITGRPVGLPGGPWFNAVLAAIAVGVGIWAVSSGDPIAYWCSPESPSSSASPPSSPLGAPTCRW